MVPYLRRQLAGEPFPSLLADWARETGFAAATLKDLLRGKYATEQAGIAYETVKYPRHQTLRFAARNFQARLLPPQLVDIRKRIAAGEQPKAVASSMRITPATLKLIVTGRYATLAMREALAIEAGTPQ